MLSTPTLWMLIGYSAPTAILLITLGRYEHRHETPRYDAAAVTAVLWPFAVGWGVMQRIYRWMGV